MRFEEFKDELDLYFGQDELPARLQKEIERDPKCKAYYEEALRLAETLGTENDFYPGKNEVERLLSDINTRLSPNTKITALTPVWYKLAGMAAVIVLLFGTFMLGNMVSFDGQTLDYYASDTSGSESQLTLTQTDQELYLPDTEDVDLLIGDYVAGRNYEAAVDILGELTDEELKYLEENFKAGDIL